jgi:hypothetical protein
VVARYYNDGAGTSIVKKTRTEDATPANVLYVPMNIETGLSAQIVVAANSRGTEHFKASVTMSWKNVSGLVSLAGSADGDVVATYAGTWTTGAAATKPRVRASFAAGEAILQFVGVVLTPIDWTAVVTLALTD